MANVFTRRSHYPRYESYRSQWLSLQLKIFNSSNSKQNQPYKIVKSCSSSKFDNSKIQILFKSNQRRPCSPLFTTYTHDYRPWSYADIKLSKNQSFVQYDKVAESSVPALTTVSMTSKRYALPNVTLPIPIRCCCTHSKQWKDQCLTQTQTNYWKNLSCCGIIHEKEINKYN
ncbi:unnamed protein product [Rotaria sp. Silwood1]|nr:unnamed protein product [Rotaria sp. Silwood1]CAF3423214.1 unnamed protein product [Rotaria sp. Silwood1]CAF3436345.1 unnamed protein product [Rotaria sp. Silwood1]CAF4561666.1 unnamed protein product [Rotaria sp. Silwood1]CAF4569316.1 unnamed protein product [Rotaria sp. Silwood1]